VALRTGVNQDVELFGRDVGVDGRHRVSENVVVELLSHKVRPVTPVCLFNSNKNSLFSDIEGSSAEMSKADDKPQVTQVEDDEPDDW
jgi:hypothetical protein